MYEEERGERPEDEAAEAETQNGGLPEENAPECAGDNLHGGNGGGKRRKVALWSKPAPYQGKKYSKSFQIALAGISCALAVAAIVVGVYAQVIVGSMFIVAEVALMIPLSKQFITTDILAYIATVILALLVSGLLGYWWLFIPFVMFFGLHPVVNCLQLKYSVNRWLALIVKMVWFDATLLVWYYALGGYFGLDQSTIWQTIHDYVWIIILVGGSLLLWLYDYIMFKVQIGINRLVYKIKK